MKKLWKKISCFCLAASILLSLCPAFLTPALGAENIQWFYYQDFSGEKTDEKFGLDHVFPADGSTIQKIEENGVDFLRLLPNDKAGTQISKWIPQVPGKPKMVLQFRVKAFLDSASSTLSWSKSNGDFLCYFQRGENNGIYDKPNGTKMLPFGIADRETWYDFSIVYDNEKQVRTIYINGEEKGTFEGNNYASGGDFKFNLSAGMNATSYVDVDYIKIFSYTDGMNPADSSLSPEPSGGNQGQETENTTAQEENFLKAFGFYDGKEAQNAPMTRGEFAGMLLKCMNAPVADYKQTYWDVPAEHPYAREINTLYYLGVISRGGDALFRPDDEITLFEVCTTFINALGYSDRAKAYGGYPYGYYQAASELGLLKGAKDAVVSGSIPRKDIFKISVNFLKTPPMMIYSIGENGYQITNNDKTLLEIYHHIYIYEGVVNAVSHTSLDSSDGVGSGYFQVKSRTLKGENMDGFLGQRITAYCDEDDNLFYYEIDAKNKTEVIYYDQDVRYQNGTLFYTVDGKDRSQSISKDVYLIYNDKAVENYNPDLYNIDYGYIQLIDNSGDSRPDVMKIYQFENYQAIRYETETEAILVENHPALKLDDEVGILDRNGRSVSPTQIAQGNILSVMYDENGKIAGVFYSSEKVSGKIESISLADKNSSILLDNQKEYRLCQNFLNNYSYVGTGSAGTFYLDILGNVEGYREGIDTSDTYGYFLAGKPEDTFSDVIDVKLLSENNKMMVVKSKAKLTLDGVRVSALDVLKSLSVRGSQMIRYRLDREGYLSSVDTIETNDKESENNRLIEFYEGSQVEYYIDPKSFGGYVFLGGSCKVFCIPPDAQTASDEDFVVGDSSVLVNAKKYDFKAYKSAEDGIGAEIILINDAAEASYNKYEYVSVLHKLITAVDSSGNLVQKVTYFYKGVEKEGYAKNMDIFKDRHTGDVMLLAFDANQKIMDYKLLYDAQKDVLVNNEGKEKRYTTHRNSLGYVYSMKDELFEMARKDPALYPEEELEMEIHRVTKNIYVYDSKKQKVSVGGAGDLIDYKSGAVNYTKIFTFDTYCVDYDIMIIK